MGVRERLASLMAKDEPWELRRSSLLLGRGYSKKMRRITAKHLPVTKLTYVCVCSKKGLAWYILELHERLE